MASRANRGATRGSCLDSVPDSPYRLDQLVLLIPELLPKVPDVNLDVVGIAEEVVAPNLIENPSPGQDLVRVHHHQPQEVDLASREIDGAAIPFHLSRRVIHRDVLHLELGTGI